MTQFLHGLLTFGIVVLILTSCANEAPESADTTPTPAVEEPDAYPAAEEPTPDAYPAAEEPTPDAYPAAEEPTPDAYPDPETTATPNEGDATTSEPFVVPTPSSSDVGNVTGKLTRLLAGGGSEPFNPAVIYLGGILESTDGSDALVELDKEVAPRAETDAQGNFVFTDVEPGRYGLMLDTPRAALLLKQPDASGDLIVEVTGGEVFELGELEYEIEGF